MKARNRVCRKGRCVMPRKNRPQMVLRSANICPVCGHREIYELVEGAPKKDTHNTCAGCVGIRTQHPELFEWVQQVVGYQIEKRFEEEYEKERWRQMEG